MKPKVSILLKAIKKNCFGCTHGKFDCELETCPLFPFRPWAFYKKGGKK